MNETLCVMHTNQLVSVFRPFFLFCIEFGGVTYEVSFVQTVSPHPSQYYATYGYKTHN